MDEKAARVEAFMLEQNQPFTMKELEQLLPKIGVPYPVVPECIETLVSENRVRSEKMGVSVFYWKFAKVDAAINLRRRRAKHANIQALEKQVRTLQQQQALDACSAAGASEEQRERDQLTVEIIQLQQSVSTLRLAVDEASDDLPVQHAELLRGIRDALDAANRWSNNLLLIEQHCRHRLGMSQSQFRSAFKMPHDFDFVDVPLTFTQQWKRFKPSAAGVTKC